MTGSRRAWLAVLLLLAACGGQVDEEQPEDSCGNCISPAPKGCDICDVREVNGLTMYCTKEPLNVPCKK